MKDIFYFFLILGLCVSMCPSQHTKGTTQDPRNDVVTNNEEDPYEDYDDPLVDADCYTEENHCNSVLHLNPKRLCVYKKNMGLTNFFGMCSIRLHNCLIKQQKKLKAFSESQHDEIYYNGKNFDCSYYGARFSSERQAIIWYFKLGGLDAETVNITQPFKNII